MKWIREGFELVEDAYRREILIKNCWRFHIQTYIYYPDFFNVNMFLRIYLVLIKKIGKRKEMRKGKEYFSVTLLKSFNLKDKKNYYYEYFLKEQFIQFK